MSEREAIVKYCNNFLLGQWVNNGSLTGKVHSIAQIGILGPAIGLRPYKNNRSEYWHDALTYVYMHSWADVGYVKVLPEDEQAMYVLAFL